MSYDYFLQAHLNEDFQEMSTEKIVRIFEPYIVRHHEDYIDLEFDEVNHSTIFFNTRDPFVSSICVNRPCGDERLAACLYEVMLLGNVVFFEPDGKAPIILDAAIEQHMPADMIETLGKPAVAQSWEDFLILYRNNR